MNFPVNNGEEKEHIVGFIRTVHHNKGVWLDNKTNTKLIYITKNTPFKLEEIGFEFT